MSVCIIAYEGQPIDGPQNNLMSICIITYEGQPIDGPQNSLMYVCIIAYEGQPIDGPQNGPAPGPWDIASSPAQLFQNQVQQVEVPHTASVKVRTPLLQ